MKIMINAGVAERDSVGGEREWYCHNQVVHAMMRKLETFKNVEVLRVDEYVHSSTYDADVYVFVTYIQSSTLNAVPYEIVATPKIIIKNGAEQTIEIHVLREARLRTILIEDHRSQVQPDYIMFHNEDYLRAEGEAIANGLATSINLKSWDRCTSEQFIDASIIILKYLESSHKGIIPAKWLKEIQAGTLNDSNAISLLYIVIHRWLIE